ncbi:MAG: PQQ-binding-like beta-propeller repeat protein [Phycisphaerales bacterium JB060]
MRSAIILLSIAGSALAQDAWTHAGRTPQRVAHVESAAPVLADPLWVYDADGLFEPIPQATPVISADGVAVVLGHLDGAAHAVGLDAATGEELWRAPIVAPIFLSWSSPAISEGGLVIVATGATAAALDLATGDQAWATDLGQSVVNASPAVEERSGVVRLTTYDPTGGSARLITLDLDTGEVLLEPTIGSASGATPSLHGLRSYVALTDGTIKAFNGGDELWTTGSPLGFFGGTVHYDGAIYAASYGFGGGRDNSGIVKLDAATGVELWSVPSERTDAMAIPLGDGRLVLSAGLEGFGSLPTVQVYDDLGTTAERAWDLATATWDDLNGNGVIDPGEYLVLGGWDHQPAAIGTLDGVALLVGAPTGGLALLDLDADPASAGFVLGSTDLGGGSPAVARGVAVSAWADHVAAFALGGPCYADFDGDGSLTIFDFLAFQNAFDAGDLAADCDGDGSLTLFDFLCFQNDFDAGCA